MSVVGGQLEVREVGICKSEHILILSQLRECARQVCLCARLPVGLLINGKGAFVTKVSQSCEMRATGN